MMCISMCQPFDRLAICWYPLYICLILSCLFLEYSQISSTIPMFLPTAFYHLISWTALLSITDVSTWLLHILLNHLNCSVIPHKPFYKMSCNIELTLIWATGLDTRFSLFRAEGERGPEELGACERGAILAPGEICMLASWAAYSCCKKEKKIQQNQLLTSLASS